MDGMVSSLSQVCLRVRDIEVSMGFYCGLLGFRHRHTFFKSDGSPFLYYLEIVPGQYLELIPAGEPIKPDGFHHMTFLVEDVTAAAQKILESGTRIYQGPAAAGCEIPDAQHIGCGGDRNPAFYVEDPDGNNIELMQFVPGNLQSQF